MLYLWTETITVFYHKEREVCISQPNFLPACTLLFLWICLLCLCFEWEVSWVAGVVMVVCLVLSDVVLSSSSPVFS
jgi:hypothetical protein